MKKNIFIRTFGCQMNEYDTELVRAVLKEAGCTLVAEETVADVVLLNTCAVRDNAYRKVVGQIHEIHHRAKGRELRIGILGCLASGLKKDLLDDKALRLDCVVGPDSYRRLPQILFNLPEGQKGFDVALSKIETYEDIHPQRTPGVNAWIAVMRGCNNFCSYCIVPFTRGRERSRSVKSIVDEVRLLVHDGYPQVTLLGQNVNSYTHEAADFSDLLNAVSEVDGLKRIRFTSPHPKDFPENLIDVLAKNPKVCKQVHFPLQAGSDQILEKMNRGYTGDEFVALAKKMKERVPELALTTDIIVGFPTETDEDYAATRRIVQQELFDGAYIFKYSPRPHTQADRDFKDDVSEEKKTERIVELNKIQNEINLKKNEAVVGQVQEVLMEPAESDSEASSFGRNDANKVVSLNQGSFKSGEFLNVKITRATPHQLKGEVIQ